MIPKTSRGSRWQLPTSPWIIIGSVGILLIVVVVLAAQNYSREKKYMSQILSEKGGGSWSPDRNDGNDVGWPTNSNIDRGNRSIA